MSISTWQTKGCAVCRDLWESGGRPTQLSISLELHTRLYRCAACLSYWEENERYADVVSDTTVQCDYPDVIIMVDPPPP
jgi:hypothetical protein